MLLPTGTSMTFIPPCTMNSRTLSALSQPLKSRVLRCSESPAGIPSIAYYGQARQQDYRSCDLRPGPIAWDMGKVGDWGPGGSEGLFFDGPNAVAANGGHLVTLYTPSEWNQGSSVSHLDPSIGEMMMTPFTGTGTRTHDYSAVEIGILTDLGYVPAVPEPETYSMMLAGLATCAWIVRRRKMESFG
jgi:hypothetical protein